MKAGSLNRLVTIQRRGEGADAAGQPVTTWEEVGKLWTNPAGQTGMGAIRSAVQSGVASSIGRYSFEARHGSIRDLGIDAGMRLLHDGMVFDIEGIALDLKRRDAAYIVATLGGNDG